MADSFNIRVGLGAFQGITQEVIARAMPAVQAGLERVADATAQRWKSAVDASNLWGAEKEAYRNSIRWEMVGPLKAEVSADYKHAQEIEEGRPARDLKRMLQTSKKVRMSKRGERYLIIPFRHNVPRADNVGQRGVMPAGVYDQARALMPSRVTGWEMQYNGLPEGKGGALVKRNRYKWGDFLQAGLAPKLQAHHASDPYAGMVRMDTSSGKSRSSVYLTFRIMRESSPGWIVPPKAGLHLARNVSQEMQPLAEQVLGAAIQRSLAP